MELNRLYKISEVVEELPRALSASFSQIPLPTEVVVYETRIVTPKMARLYMTELYLYRGEIKTFGEIRNIIQEETGDFKGLFGEETERVHLAEQWCDGGSDGYEESYLIGYRYIVFPIEKEWNDFPEYRKKGHKFLPLIYESHWLYEKD